MRKAILLAALLGTAGAASAADNGFYIGGSYGQAKVEVDDSFAELDGDDTGYKFIVGFRPLDWLAVEANYVDFGKVEGDDEETAESKGISVFGVALLPLGPIDLFAKGGLVKWDIEVGSGDDISKEDGNNLAYGAGVQFRLLSLSIRAEYEKFDVAEYEDLNMMSVGFTYTFL